MTPFYKIESSVMDEMVKMDAELRAENERLRAAMAELAYRWVDMAQSQMDIANKYDSARAEGTAETLRMCALMLREALAHHATPQAGEDR